MSLDIIGYGAPIAITINDYTCQQDGVFVVTCNYLGGSYCHGLVNGVLMVGLSAPASYAAAGYQAASISVFKWQTIRISHINGSAKFYPFVN